MKPHIYLHIYPSGLSFWRVSRTPHGWIRLSGEEKLLLQAAHQFVDKLNRERHDVETTTSGGPGGISGGRGDEL